MEAFLQEIPSCLRVRRRHFVLTTHAWSRRSWLVGTGQKSTAEQSSRADQGYLAIGEASRCRAPDWVGAAKLLRTQSGPPVALNGRRSKNEQPIQMPHGDCPCGRYPGDQVQEIARDRGWLRP